MHNFSELIQRCGAFTLNNLGNLEINILEELETSAATIHIKNLQMINLQKTIFVIGAFSIFESILQENLSCTNGFEEAKKILKQNNETLLIKKFSEIQLAINALKHGKGRSYNTLVKSSNQNINARIKQPNEIFFNEGGVDEINTLIKVDNEFIEECLDVIDKVSESIRKAYSDIQL